MTRLVEFRTYQLTPGAGAEFHELATRQSIPMARASGMDVLAHGPSLHDADAYFLIRAYDKLEHRDALEAAFYASAAWREGPREAIVGRIESDLDAIVPVTDDAIDALRRSAMSRVGLPTSPATEPSIATQRVVEIRTLALHPASGSRFHALFKDKSLPLMRDAGMDVVAFGPSAHDPDVYVVVRSFESLSSREAGENAYYNSAAWREGPREAMLALVRRYLDAVMWLPVAAVEGLRRGTGERQNTGERGPSREP